MHGMRIFRPCGWKSWGVIKTCTIRNPLLWSEYFNIGQYRKYKWLENSCHVFNSNNKKISTNLHSSDFPPTLTRTYVRWAKKRLLKRERKLRALITKVEESNQAAIHCIRIEAKKIRYLAETLPSDTKAVKRMIKHLKSVQSALGDIHDLTRLESHVISIRRPSRHDFIAVLKKEQHRIFHRCQNELENLPQKLNKEIHKFHL